MSLNHHFVRWLPPPEVCALSWRILCEVVENSARGREVHRPRSRCIEQRAASSALMTGVQIDIPVSSPLPHAEVAGSVEPETRNLQAGRTYRRRHPVTAACAAEVEVWRDAMRALRGMSRQSAVASVTSGLICGLVMFVFCVVFSEMIFGQHELLMRAVPAQSPP